MDNLNIIFLRSDIASNDPVVDHEEMDFLFELKKAEFNVKTTGTPLFYILTGGSEEKFKLIYHLYKEPFYIISTSHSNSLPASLEIMSFLRSKNLKGYLIHGEIDEIINQIRNIPTRLDKDVFRTSFKTKLLDDENLGVIGKPSDWLIASKVDYNDVKERLGANLIDIDYQEFMDDINEAEVNLDIYGPFIKFYKNEKINEEEIIKALKIHLALLKIIEKYKLAGLTVRCFDLLGTVKSTSCLAFAFLNSNDITATCEGDIPAMLTMRIVKRYFDADSFQANPSYINTLRNYFILAHCTVPYSMAYATKLDTHFESGIGIGIKGELSEENVTVFKLSNTLDEFMVIEGNISENLNKPNLCRTQIKVRTNDDISTLLSHPLGNHLIVLYGHKKADILKLLIEK